MWSEKPERFALVLCTPKAGHSCVCLHSTWSLLTVQRTNKEQHLGQFLPKALPYRQEGRGRGTKSQQTGPNKDTMSGGRAKRPLLLGLAESLAKRCPGAISGMSLAWVLISENWMLLPMILWSDRFSLIQILSLLLCICHLTKT